MFHLKFPIILLIMIVVVGCKVDPADIDLLQSEIDNSGFTLLQGTLDDTVWTVRDGDWFLRTLITTNGKVTLKLTDKQDRSLVPNETVNLIGIRNGDVVENVIILPED